MDAVFKRDSQSGPTKHKPESRYTTQMNESQLFVNSLRLISCIPGGVLLVGGLFMYGFTALKTHFMVVSGPLNDDLCLV